MNIKENMLYNEINLCSNACKDSDALRIDKYIEDIRPNYFRDIDKIIHSLSYTRYNDKTQVYSNKNNDHISKRIIHVQLVSKIARTIGRALRLNEDLIEAIALGHDLGHVPFGHTGERILNKISLENNEGYFMHNVQSVRTLMNLENNGYGKNITIQVLDGILCHNGERLLKKYEYKKKSKEEFLTDYNNCYKDKKFSSNLIPMTLEACIVRISDIIAYIGRDLEDAIEIGKLNKKDIPNEVSIVLGDDNAKIINTLIMDIIINSYDKPYIELSNEKYTALNELIKFNYENIYNKANSVDQLSEYDFMFNVVFKKCMYILENKITDTNIYKFFLNNMSDEYKKNTNVRIVLDYIAGMTDSFFIDEFNTLKKI